MPHRRPSLLRRLMTGVRHPLKALAVVRSVVRHALLRVRSRGDYATLYRLTTTEHRPIPPSASIKDLQAWSSIGAPHLAHFRGNGLTTASQVLEVGCGSLSIGWHLIQFLNPGAYTGIDLSPDSIFSAQATVHDRNLQAKQAHLLVVPDYLLLSLPPRHFDLVFTHEATRRAPIAVIDALIGSVQRVLAPDGVVELTVNETVGRSWNRAGQHHHSVQTISEVAARRGFDVARVYDWPFEGTRLRLKVTPRRV